MITWSVYLFLVVGNQVIDVLRLEEQYDLKQMCEYHAITSKNSMSTMITALGNRVKVDQVLWACREN